MAPHQATAGRARPRRSRRWLLALGSLVLTLCLAECGLRILDLPRTDSSLTFLGEMGPETDSFQEDTELFWRLSPDARGYHVNELGLRGFLPIPAKGDRDFRIACIGDSCTFGSGVRYEETYGVRLERLLQNFLPSRRVETVLAAVPGYSTHQNRLLFGKHILPLQPDLTVLYCGGWNDYLPAISLTDRERTAWREGSLYSLRLVRLVEGALQALGPDRQSYSRSLTEGNPPDGRRVSLAEFRENMTWMIRRAQEAGSTVVLIVPPMTKQVIRDVPIALDYRQVVRDLARDHGLALVDGPRLFDQYSNSAVGDWGDLPAGEWPYLRDWIHPNPTGHAVLAEELFRVVRDGLPVEDAPDPADRTLAIASLSPDSLHPLIDNRLEVRGAGFSQPDAFSRIRLGDWWVPDVELVDDQRIELAIPRTIPPGDYRLELSTPTGPMRSEMVVTVEPPDLAAELLRDGDGNLLEVTSTGPAGWPLTIWFANAIRSEPAGTAYGPFHLAADPDGRPEGFPETPFYFEKLELVQSPGRFDSTGAFRLRQELPPSVLQNFSDGIFIQAAVGDPDMEYHAVLSRVVSLPVPGR